MAEVINVTVPDIGDFMEIPIIEILVKSGDSVSKDTPLVVLESDKATMEVPSPEAGTVKDLKVIVGARVSVGSLLLTLHKTSDDAQLISEKAPVAAIAPETPSKVQPVADPGTAVSRETAAPPTVLRTAHGSPSIRRIAREFGIELTAVTGAGPRGRIVREDLHKFVKTALTAPAPPAAGDNVGGFKLAPWPQIDFSRFGPIERAQLSKVRKLSGASLARNAVVIPHVTNFEDADVTELDAFRRSINVESGTAGRKVTLLPFLIKAAAYTLQKYENFNSSLDGDELVLKRYFHVGFAADTPNGLVVPVIRDVSEKGVLQIATEAVTLAALARDGKLKPADMQGGCFTISSLGGIGGTGFTPIINAPEVAILGATRAQWRPVWNGSEFQPRLILPLMLSWDHRVVDGASAARFLTHVATLLADFRRAVL